jgi:hypothetical protein
MTVAIRDAKGKARAVENLHVAVYPLPDKDGVTSDKQFAEFTIVGQWSKWSDCCPLDIFRIMNPDVELVG